MDSSTPLTVWTELAFIIGCMWYANVKGRKLRWGLLGLFGPLGIAMVACLENKAKNFSEQVAHKFRVLHWLFWGIVVFQIASSIFFLASHSATRTISCFMKDMPINIALALMSFCVLKGAKWARVSCYVLSVVLALPMLIFWQRILHLGVVAIYDVWIAEESLTDYCCDTGSVLLYMSFGCLIAGTVCLLDSNVQKVLANMKSSSRLGWLWCLLFWSILTYFIIG